MYNAKFPPTLDFQASSAHLPISLLPVSRESAQR